MTSHVKGLHVRTKFLPVPDNRTQVLVHPVVMHVIGEVIAEVDLDHTTGKPLLRSCSSNVCGAGMCDEPLRTRNFQIISEYPAILTTN